MACKKKYPCSSRGNGNATAVVSPCLQEHYEAVMRRTMERSQRMEQRQKRWSWGGLSTDSEGRTGTDPLSRYSVVFAWKVEKSKADASSPEGTGVGTLTPLTPPLAAVLPSRRFIRDRRAAVGSQFACEWGVEGSVCVPPALLLCRAPAGDVSISCARCRRGSPQAPGVTGSRRHLLPSLPPSLPTSLPPLASCGGVGHVLAPL